MKLENTDLGVSLSVPDRPTVRQHLAYYSGLGLAQGTDLYVRYWRAAQAILSDWECEAMPEPDVDLDESADPQHARIIMWAGMAVFRHINSLETVPKG